jgi:hypothetical protein
LSEAWRHCEIADSILASAPNAWLSAAILQNRMCIATFKGDFKLALALLGSGKQAAESCGDVRLMASLASNAAHIQMFTGDFEAGSSWLQQNPPDRANVAARTARGSRRTSPT